jgi:hypothetical protein
MPVLQINTFLSTLKHPKIYANTVDCSVLFACWTILLWFLCLCLLPIDASCSTNRGVGNGMIAVGYCCDSSEVMEVHQTMTFVWGRKMAWKQQAAAEERCLYEIKGSRVGRYVAELIQLCLIVEKSREMTSRVFCSIDIGQGSIYFKYVLST